MCNNIRYFDFLKTTPPAKKYRQNVCPFVQLSMPARPEYNAPKGAFPSIALAMQSAIVVAHFGFQLSYYCAFHMYI